MMYPELAEASHGAPAKGYAAPDELFSPSFVVPKDCSDQWKLHASGAEMPSGQMKLASIGSSLARGKVKLAGQVFIPDALTVTLFAAVDPLPGC